MHRVVEEINRHYGVMRAEAVRLNQQMGNLKTEKTALEKEIVRMTKRIEEIEDAIGKDSDDENNWRAALTLQGECNLSIASFG